MSFKLSYFSPIDTHVHLRWNESGYISTEGMNFMQLGFRDAERIGLRAMIEMPNTTPQLIGHESINERLNLVDGEGVSLDKIYHGVYGGVTNDRFQNKVISSVAEISRRKNGRVKGLKIYCAHSTGDMGVTDEENQRMFWKEITFAGYKGVVTCHLEDEECYDGDFDYQNPMSHSLKQTPESELSQAKRQIKNAYDAGFEGTVISAHTSNPQTIDYILSERKKGKLPFRLLVEMTWHHPLLNTGDYSEFRNGVKMNPPLRSPVMQKRNLDHILKGNVDFIGTDHAPHDPAVKLDSNNPKPPSGIPGILAWPLGIAMLRKQGIDESLLRKVIFDNANSVFFNGELKPRMVEVEYEPGLWEAYGYNPFSRIERELGIAA